MECFQLVHAAGADPATVQERLMADLGPVAEEARLGFVYASAPMAGRLESLLAELQQLAPRVQWVGTLGIGLCYAGREVYDEPAAALLLTDIPECNFRLMPQLDQGYDSLPETLRSWLQEQGYCFCMVHGDPSNPRTPELLQELGERLPMGFINGGLTSSHTLNHQVAGGLCSGGISGVMFDAAVEIITDHTQGCAPMGPARAISEVRNNVLISVDHRPALEVMKEDMGEVLARDLSRIGGYVFVALPIAGSDTGDYLVRNLLGLDLKQGYVAVGDYLQGQEKVMFCRRDGNTAREDMRRMLERVARRVDGRPIRGGVYISCLGRGRQQFGSDSEEVQMIHQALGEFPMLGFFANGEIYNGRLYGYTGVLTLFM